MEDTIISELKMTRFFAKNITFTLNETFISTNQEVTLTPNFKRQINKIDNNTAEVRLFFDIDKNEDLPFEIHVELVGSFELKNWESEELLPVMSTNTVAIMFPYLRTIVSSLTTNANIPPYIIPIINIARLLEKTE